MLTGQSILNMLHQSLPDLQLLGVKQVGLYGSYVRGEQHAQSDIDILVDVDYDKFAFSRYAEACDLLEGLFAGTKVSIVTKGGLNKMIGPNILKEVVYA